MMANDVESDLEFARRLDRELNGSGDGATSAAFITNINRFGSLNAGDLIILASDSDDDDTMRNRRSRSPVSNIMGQVSCENQQGITIKRERTSRNDYFMPIIHTYLDLENNQEWALVNMESNVQQMFDKMKNQFWSSWLKDVNYTVKWDLTCVISDDSSFKIFETHKQVLINANAMTRPRIQLISVLLHILIHIYLNVSSKGAIKLNLHDDNFRGIMLFLNSTIKTQITTFHKFPHTQEEEDYPNQWYQCTGICLNYEPFKGAIRCSSIPNERHSFWKAHDEVCGGQFFKIFEMSRTNPDSNDEEKKYVRNVRYMFPKPRVDVNGRKKEHPKTNIQVRELFDLTDETRENAIVQNLCDVIDLDATDYNLDSPTEPMTSAFVTNFTKQSNQVFEKCPFCMVNICPSKFEAHFDYCRGYQQKVEFSMKKFK